MNKADEMFKKLGYTKIWKLPIRNLIQYEKIINYCHTYIEFNLNYKSFRVFYTNDVYCDIPESITMKELKAINQIIKELGWLE